MTKYFVFLIVLYLFHLNQCQDKTSSVEESVITTGEEIAADISQDLLGNISNVDNDTGNMTIVEGNVTDTLSNNTTSNGTEVAAETVFPPFHASCLENKTNNGQPIEIVNGNRLISLLQMEPNVTSRHTPATCVMVLFYSPSCPFSCAAAPHYNALPKVFPNIKMVAVDAMTQFYFNAQYGIVGVPTLVLFHNGRPAGKFNETSEFTLEAFSRFIVTYTDIKPVSSLMQVSSDDFKGPVSSVCLKERDYFLILSWAFILTCAVYSFYRSFWWRWLVDATLSAWREAEAQHHHAD